MVNPTNSSKFLWGTLAAMCFMAGIVDLFACAYITHGPDHWYDFPTAMTAIFVSVACWTGFAFSIQKLTEVHQ